MKKLLSICFLIASVMLLQSHIPIKKTPKVLVFSKTKGYRHGSIELGKTTIQKLGLEHNFAVDTTEDASKFTDENLKNYSAVIFLSTTGDVLNQQQQIAFERYIQAGGGYVGVHAATDTEYDWPWYGKLAGAYFSSHPAVQEARFVVKDKKHPSTKFLTDSVWMHKDELYNFKQINPDLKVLVTIDEKSYKGGTNGNYHPFSWYHDFDGGRAFYTSMGHTDETWRDDKFLKHLLGGLEYAIGKQKLDYSKSHSKM
ncbi:Crp/Fnr family transcriptional regulator [Pedobacter yonginense]|uniref:Crp/Fnr family transcriptional regulator n=1 Tax=Pedobacter yonginense TaxID=651869 RepID=A0A317EP75_9SPHI|nr:ThuA domain-containing protein [Pedobacter yonginense]PWS27769.1 Crp/Fnr family transcriptional regulator [Pedobacter yonginense]